jgi:RsmE family RNA methyltransferase
MAVVIENMAHCQGEILSQDPVGVVIELRYTCAPLPRLPLELIVGLSRPQTLKKVIQFSTELGVRALHLVRCAQSERSYLDSSILTSPELELQTILGREQGIDCCAPEIIVHDRFKPFIEDTLPVRERALVATSGSALCKIIACTRFSKDDLVLPERSSSAVVAVGPELGWNDFERQLFIANGFLPQTLGLRSLRVENALALLVGQVMRQMSSSP